MPAHQIQPDQAGQVYVASALINAETVRRYQAILQECGCIITCDWTQNIIAPSSDYESYQAAAKNEIEGIRNANVVFVVMPGERGTHFEFGFAYALKKPVVMLLEKAVEPWPAFYYLNNIVRCWDEDEAIALVVALAKLHI